MEDTHFSDGISYRFNVSAIIEQGAFIVLFSSPKWFNLRYQFWPLHHYRGSLDNVGEKIEFNDPSKNDIFSLTYNAGLGWPMEPKLDENSLVPTEFNLGNDQGDFNFWRASYDFGCSQGRDDYSSANSEETILSPSQFLLNQNYPNPFKEFTYIDYQLESEAHVEIVVFNMIGQFITELTNSNYPEGLHEVQWNRTSHPSELVPASVYFYPIVVSGFRKTQVLTNRMLIVD